MLFQFTIISTFLAFALANNPTKLKKYDVEATETSVSGISSGGYFATQMQISFSSIIKGAGIIAAGNYNCGSEKFVPYCMGISWPYTTQVSQTKSWSGHHIDPIENLKRQKVYMISGTRDYVVVQGNVDLLYNYYTNFIPKNNIVYKKDLSAGHTFPTDFDSEGNNACDSSSSPFISNCKFDAAGAILRHIYGDLNKRSKNATGELIEFDQSEFHNDPNSIGLSKSGYIYVPKNCQKQKCRLHVAFHGCKQNVESIGTLFLKNSGFDLWADENNIIILFPQTHADSHLHITSMNGMLNNLNACWDWVGWYGSDFATREGKQTSTIKKMIDRITGA